MVVPSSAVSAHARMAMSAGVPLNTTSVLRHCDENCTTITSLSAVSLSSATGTNVSVERALVRVVLVLPVFLVLLPLMKNSVLLAFLSLLVLVALLAKNVLPVLNRTGLTVVPSATVTSVALV